MLIDQVSWMCFEVGSGTASFSDVEIHMGLRGEDFLGSSFEGNYLPGTRTLVFQAESLGIDASPGEWYSVDLDTPYAYDGSANLLIEVFHLPGPGSVWSWHWTAGEDRMLYVWSSSSPVGILGDDLPCMILSGGQGLEQTTFGAIKHIFSMP